MALCRLVVFNCSSRRSLPMPALALARFPSTHSLFPTKIKTLARLPDFVPRGFSGQDQWNLYRSIFRGRHHEPSLIWRLLHTILLLSSILSSRYDVSHIANANWSMTLCFIASLKHEAYLICTYCPIFQGHNWEWISCNPTRKNVGYSWSWLE